MSNCIKYEKDDQNIVTLTIDMLDRKVNVINDEFRKDFKETADRLEAEDPLAGVIIASAKKTFFAGAELDWLYAMRDPEVVFNMIQSAKADMRRVETLGVPVVAAINGAALGGGLELALACHRRIAIDDPKTKIGLPEVTLGLLPGGGGVCRMTRMLGLQGAFPFIMEGKQVGPQEAKEVGIVDDLASDRDDMMAKAKEWILANPESAQPWDQKKYRMPGGDPRSPRVAQMLAIGPAMLRKKTYRNYPAPEAIMTIAAEGALLDFDIALRIESRHFARIATGNVAKNMINAFWYQLNEIKGGGSRPKDIKPIDTKKVGVLGAGMMGHGIAYVSAQAGMDVVLKDVSKEKADEGKAAIDKIMSKRVEKGRMTEEKKQAILDRIQTTESAEDLKGCDLIVEAVFENRELKAQVTQEAEAQIAEDAVFGTNTSTLPITGLAEPSARPENFIGIHFFSPVHRMQLVEIIVGEKTSDRTLAKTFDYVLKIKKTPIVVNDSRGFFTSRVFGMYPFEGAAMLEEGQNPRAIESAGLKAGFPVGPLNIADEVNLGLVLHIHEQTKRDLAAEGLEVPHHPAHDVMYTMVKDKNRPGKAQGAGFYEYPKEGKKFLWPGLKDIYPLKGEKLSQEEMIDRMWFAQANEAARAFEEGVVTSVADANLGSIFGWGFSPFKGGVLQFINDYGLKEFVERSRELAAKYGVRFEPTDLLVKMAEKGETF
jgi:3-hydroxyacyl-CoA dehydrogenase/enoyl-CoA hydratase/3-hydroxybutyryl-CoA epimerase